MERHYLCRGIALRIIPGFNVPVYCRASFVLDELFYPAPLQRGKCLRNPALVTGSAFDVKGIGLFTEVAVTPKPNLEFGVAIGVKG